MVEEKRLEVLAMCKKRCDELGVPFEDSGFKADKTEQDNQCE